jgi:hypothetical protein
MTKLPTRYRPAKSDLNSPAKFTGVPLLAQAPIIRPRLAIAAGDFLNNIQKAFQRWACSPMVEEFEPIGSSKHVKVSNLFSARI